MKGFLKFLVFVAVLGAAIYLTRPYWKDYVANKGEGLKELGEKLTAEAAEEKGEKEKEAGKAVETEVAGKAETPMPEKPSSSEIEDAVMALYPDPVIAPLIEMVNNWSFIPPRAFPRNLVLKEKVDFDLERDGKIIGKRGVPPGSAIIAKAYSEMRVKISPEGSDLMEAIVPIDATNLKESIEKGYDAFVVDTRKRVEAQREAERTRIANMEAAAGEREKLLAGWTDGSDSVFDPMKVSLKTGGLKDRRFEDVVRWRWLGSETVNGVTYDAGLVEVQVETIFGVFPSEWKALIRNGRVEKWVDPVSGREG